MARRPVKIFLPVLLALLSVSGCWDSINIEDRDICTTVIVDKKDDQYTFYVEVAGITSKIQNPQSEQASGQLPNTSVVKGSGKTYAEARACLDKALNKPLFLGAVQSLILTERLADIDIEEYTLRLRQLIAYRKTMDVIVTPDEPEVFLKVQPSNETTVGFAVETTLETTNRLGMTFHMSLADLLQKLQSRNPCYLMNTLSVREGEISLIGNTVFDKGKRLGFIPFQESRGITFLSARLRKKPKFDYVINFDNTTFTLETTLKKRSIQASYDGVKPTFVLNMNYEAVTQYPSERVEITDEMRRQVSDKLREQIQSDIRRTIDTSQKEYECDYLSFSEPFRIAYPESFEVMDWHEGFKKAEFTINISVSVIPNTIVDYNPEPIL